MMALGRGADQRVGALRDSSSRPLGVLARAVKHGTPSTVVSSWTPPSPSARHARGPHHAEELEVAQRLEQAQAAARDQARGDGEAASAGRVARVDREEQRDVDRDVLDARPSTARRTATWSTVAGAVQRHSARTRPADTPYAERVEDRGGPGPGGQQRVDHHVADEVHLLRAAMPVPHQVLLRPALCP